MFNYRKFARNRFAEAPATQPQSGQPNSSQSGKILNDLDAKNPSDAKAKEQVDPVAQKMADTLSNARRDVATATDLFNKLGQALTEVKDSPFSKIQPVSMTKPCDSLSEMLDPKNVVNPDEIKDIYQQYINAFRKKQTSLQALLNTWYGIKDTPLVWKVLSIEAKDQNNTGAKDQNNAGSNQGLQSLKSAEQKLQEMEYDLKLDEVRITKQQRQFMQFDILYQDMFNYYSLLSRICETKTRYDAQVEQFKFGNQEDYQALLSYYEYGISLLQIMAPKAASIMPTQAKNIQSYYGSIIESAKAEISKLSVQPLKALYGRN